MVDINNISDDMLKRTELMRQSNNSERLAKAAILAATRNANLKVAQSIANQLGDGGDTDLVIRDRPLPLFARRRGLDVPTRSVSTWLVDKTMHDNTGIVNSNRVEKEYTLVSSAGDLMRIPIHLRSSWHTPATSGLGTLEVTKPELVETLTAIEDVEGLAFSHAIDELETATRIEDATNKRLVNFVIAKNISLENI